MTYNVFGGMLNLAQSIIGCSVPCGHVQKESFFYTSTVSVDKNMVLC